MAEDYDGFAEAYAAETESNLINGYYTRPAILGLAGDVAGRRILDVGCGAGPLLEALRDRGAVVTGAEPSAKMLELAGRRLGEGAVIRPGGDYFATHEYFEDYTFGGRSVILSHWHRPLHTMTSEFTAAGFRIAVISEPPPAPEARELFPEVFARRASGEFVCFLFFVLEAP